jgi:hypothetical protein
MNVRPVSLDAGDAIELSELLEFLAAFFNDHDIVSALGQFTASSYSIEELLADLGRFAFLLGGTSEQFIVDPP